MAGSQQARDWRGTAGIAIGLVSLLWTASKDLIKEREVVEVRATAPPAGTDFKKLYAGVQDPLNVEFFDIVNLGDQAVHVRGIEPPELMLSLGENREIPPGGYRTVRTALRGGLPPSLSGTMIVLHTTRGVHRSNVEAGSILAQVNRPTFPKASR
jgi:hypothetical protein